MSSFSFYLFIYLFKPDWEQPVILKAPEAEWVCCCFIKPTLNSGHSWVLLLLNHTKQNAPIMLTETAPQLLLFFFLNLILNSKNRFPLERHVGLPDRSSYYRYVTCVRYMISLPYYFSTFNLIIMFLSIRCFNNTLLSDSVMQLNCYQQLACNPL